MEGAPDDGNLLGHVPDGRCITDGLRVLPKPREYLANTVGSRRFVLAVEGHVNAERVDEEVVLLEEPVQIGVPEVSRCPEMPDKA